MEENQTNELAKLERERKSRKRIFILLVLVCLLLIAAIVYEIITLVK